MPAAAAAASAAAIAGPVIAEIATSLLKKFSKKLGSNSPDQASLEQLLARLVLEEFTDFGGDDTDHGVGQAEKAISKLKRLLLGEIAPDGSPTKQLIDFVFKSCLGNSQNRDLIFPSESRVNRSVPRADLIDFMYWVEQKDLPEVDGDPKLALQLLEQAFFEWQKVAFIRVQRVDKAKDADVLIVRKRIDGPSGKLALASVGSGPGDHRIKDFTIDDSETWTREKFLSTMIHEIGHLIGLEHSSSHDEIMFNTLTTFAAPQPGDVKRAVAIWGTPPTRPTADAKIEIS